MDFLDLIYNLPLMQTDMDYIHNNKFLFDACPSILIDDVALGVINLFMKFFGVNFKPYNLTTIQDHGISPSTVNQVHTNSMLFIHVQHFGTGECLHIQTIVALNRRDATQNLNLNWNL